VHIVGIASGGLMLSCVSRKNVVVQNLLGEGAHMDIRTPGCEGTISRSFVKLI
jgi:hypothetical protein